MFLRLTYLVLLSISLGRCGQDILQGRIIGGNEAVKHQFPYQVSLQRFNVTFSHFCGGSIISPRFVITAGHCTHDKDPQNVRIVAGTNLRSDPGLSNGGEGVFMECLEFIPHPDFDMDKLNPDLALIRTAKDFEFGEGIQPIPLPKEDHQDPVQLTVSGWGYMNHAEKTIPEELQYLRVTTYDVKLCDAYMIQFRVGTCHVCTKGPEGMGVCNGDSGGPLVNDKGELIGLVSFGILCARGFPDAYCRVYCFTDWINGVLES